MPAPEFASNAFLEINNTGGGIRPIGVLRCTTKIDHGRNSNAKATPTMTGEVGFSTGVGMSEVSTTVAAVVNSQQQLDLIALYESKRSFGFKTHVGGRTHPGTGIIDSLSLSSETNGVAEYSIKISAADGKSS